MSFRVQRLLGPNEEDSKRKGVNLTLPPPTNSLSLKPLKPRLSSLPGARAPSKARRGLGFLLPAGPSRSPLSPLPILMFYWLRVQPTTSTFTESQRPSQAEPWVGFVKPETVSGVN